MIKAMQGCAVEKGAGLAKALENPLRAKRLPNRKELLLTKNFLLSKVVSSYQKRGLSAQSEE